MTKDTMLGRITQLLVRLPLERLGVVRKLIEVLDESSDWQVWFDECKKFLRKELCWTGVAETVANKFLKLISGNETLMLDALDGTEILADAKDVFVYIDSDFKRWGADEQGEATKETSVEVHELTRDAIFAEFFCSTCVDVRKLCFTQAQIKNFCVKHRGWLRGDGYSTYFLFKSNYQFFVARVFFVDDGGLGVHVDQLGDGRCWNAEYRYHVVLPQLA